MKKIKWVAVLLILQACENDIREEISDGSNSHFVKSTYRKGDLESRTTFVKNNGKEVLDGPYVEYYNGGQIKTQRFYKLGKLDSLELQYSQNGQLLAEFNRYEGKPIGRQLKYYDNGNLKEARLSGGADSLLCTVEFNRDGTIKKIEGVPLHIHANSVRIKQEQEPFEVVNTVLQLENFKTELFVRLFNPNNQLVYQQRISQFALHNRDSYFYFATRLGTLGTYRYSASVTVRDINDKIVYDGGVSDTIECVN